jgi:hypothetical protein
MNNGDGDNSSMIPSLTAGTLPIDYAVAEERYKRPNIKG